MGIRQEFFLEENLQGALVRSNIIEETEGKTRSILRVFPVDQYEFPEEIKRQAKEWHVLKVPLLGQRVIEAEDSDWCGRTSASMAYNYYQLLKGGDQRQRYITHSRAGDPECVLDLRYPAGERAFFSVPSDTSYKKGWTKYLDIKNSYQVGGDIATFPANANGEYPPPVHLLFPAQGSHPNGLGGVLGFKTPGAADRNTLIGNVLPDPLRHEVEGIRGSEVQIRERFAHIIECLRANNPVVIYTGIGQYSQEKKRDPLHIIVISGYCILKVGSEDQLWLVTADPSSKKGLVTKGLFNAPAPDLGVDLGLKLEPNHNLFRMRGGISLISRERKGFASFNLIRAKTFFERNPETKNPQYNLFLDHSQSPCGRYSYREKRIEAPPEVVDSSFNRPKYSLPLRGNTASTSPWQGYHNNESLDTGMGGYYVLGLQRNLHGGVHLFPPPTRKLVPVSAALPGYVVAARLPGDKAPCVAEGMLETFGNWPGFVLVRHAVEEVPQKESKATPRRGTFYSLYMHLSSPDFASAASSKGSKAASTLDQYFLEVPWFRTLYKQRFGAWVNLTGEGAAAGTLRWAQEPVSEADQQPPRPGGAARKVKVLGDSGVLEDITLCDDQGRVHWLYKAPQANLVAALESLEKGQVVTFAEPFFPVDAGQTLGLLRPLPAHTHVLHGRLKEHEADSNTPDFARKGPALQGDAAFLHFQVFSPADAPDNGIELLTQLASTIDTLGGAKPGFIELKDTQDNFLEVEEIKNQLTRTLPPEDRDAFTTATSAHFKSSSQCDEGGFGYAPAVATFLHNNTSFAPKAPDPAWETCHRFCYPLTLEVERVYLPVPEQNTMLDKGSSYELELRFEQAEGDDWKSMARPKRCGCKFTDERGVETCEPARLKIDASKLSQASEDGTFSFSLMVPALAERVVIKAVKGFVLEQVVALPGADGRLFVEGITRRWRNVRLIHNNEWTPGNAQKVLDKLFQALELETKARPRKEDVAQISWCDPEKESHITRLVEGEEKPGTPLFSDSGALAPQQPLDNLHPITSVWLINVLDKQRLALMREDWAAPGFRAEDPRPLYFGWVGPEGALRLGDTLLLTVIDEDYGYDKGNRVALRLRQGARLLPLSASQSFGPGGVISQPFTLPVWGDWTLELTDTATPPQTLAARKPLKLLRTQLSIPRPKLRGEQNPLTPVLVEQLVRLADGSWRWFLPFEDPVPRELPGFVSMRLSETAQGPAKTLNEAMIPVTAQPVMGQERPAIDEALFVLDAAKDFVIGLTEPGVTALANKKSMFLVKDLVGFKDCLEVMDIRVGWGLVLGLAALKASKQPFTLKSIAADGLTCTLEAPKLDKLGAALKSAGVPTKELPGKKGKVGPRLRVTFASARCEEPLQLAAWLFDETCEFILRNNPPTTTRLGVLPYTDYVKACQVDPSFHLHVMLVAALERVARLGPNRKLPKLVRIETGGLACVLDASAKGVEDRVREAAAQAGTFDVEPLDGKQLRITAQPGRKNWLCVTFSPNRFYDTLAQGDLEPGAQRFYWFSFIALNGQSVLHPVGAPSTGEGDGSITRDRFEQLRQQAFDSIQLTHTRPGTYRKVGLRPMNPRTGAVLAFRTVPRAGACTLELTACVSGVPEDLGQYTARFSRRAPNSQKWEPLKNFTALKPGKLTVREGGSVADWLVSARVPFPQAQSNKKSPLDGVNHFRLELFLRQQDSELGNISVEAAYDFTPRWVGDLEVECKGDTLELRCHAEGVETPIPGARDTGTWGNAREFEVVIEPDVPAYYLIRSSAAQTTLSEFVRYATPAPTKARRGGCDANGDFVARLDVKTLEPGARYSFSVRRPLANKQPLPVRQFDMGPCMGRAPFIRSE